MQVGKSYQFTAYASEKPLKVIMEFEAIIKVEEKSIVDKFFVIEGGNQALLGRAASEKLGVLRVGKVIQAVTQCKELPKIKGEHQNFELKAIVVC
jgi:hypothetical protein